MGADSEKGKAADMEQIDNYLRINLTNQRNSIHITDLKNDYSEGVIAQLYV